MLKIIFFLNDIYSKPEYFLEKISFKSNDKKYVMFHGEKIGNDKYIDNTIGNFLGFLPKNYSNLLTINNTSRYNINGLEYNLEIKFNSRIDLDKMLYLIHLSIVDLSFYLVNSVNNKFTFVNILNIQIKNINFNNNTIEITTNQLFDSNGNILVNNTQFDSIIHPIISENIINDPKQSYILLQIPELNRFDSIDTITQNSFSIINISDNSRVFENSKPGMVKYFNPPLPKLNKLSIKFYKHGGKLYNFNGLDHCIILSIEYLNQPYQVGF